MTYLQTCGDGGREKFDGICQALLADLHARCSYYLTVLEKEEGFFLTQKNCAQSQKLISAAEEYLLALLREKDYFACAMVAVKFPNSQSIKEETPREIATHILRVKGLVADIKDLQKQVASTLSYEEEYVRFCSSMKTSRALAKYLLAVDGVYSRLKKEKDVLDYSDLEHFALHLLQKEEMQTEMRKKYDYVFVDEYQDVNPVQEKLLAAVSGDNLFLVGDVKQSIYGFRGSKSKFFVEKEKEYSAHGHNALILPQNFRSAPAVLEAVNTQFGSMMTKENTAVDYEKEGKMQTGGLYVDGDGKEAYGRVRVHFCEKLSAPEKQPIEGIYSVKTGKKKGGKIYSSQVQKAVQIIRQEVKYGQWYDVKTREYKKVESGDIAVLYRGVNTDVTDLAAALAAAEIPTVGGESVNVCDYPEIKTLIDILYLVDNERQDVPLCSALIAF
ncbi:MAG: UvrD-helicase domain-containing protein, partial [Clostridia bacterium]|nr:UvrD-helicase domain-containing protein [Clostridia bacterium]